jgi:hypothetical protein
MSRWFRWLGWCGRIFTWGRREPLVEPWNSVTARVYAGPVTLPPMGLEGIPVLPAEPAMPPVTASAAAEPTYVAPEVEPAVEAPVEGPEPAAARTAA